MAGRPSARASKEAVSSLQEMYGGNVTVDTIGRTVESSGRYNDSPPWIGGDAILIAGSAGTCSSWFKMKGSDGQQYSATAAHCGGNTGSDSAVTSGDGFTHFGSIRQRLFSGALDASLIHVASAVDDIWADPTTTTRDISAISAADNVGVLLCTDGVTDREVCSARIDATGQSSTYGGHTTQALVKAHQTAGVNAFSPGDSGGPVIEALHGSNGARAVGMITSTVTSDHSIGFYRSAKVVARSLTLDQTIDCGTCAG